MHDREACERRVYRLALLLTGNVNAAWRVIAAVLDAQPDLRSLDGAHMDRLTVLRSREIAPAQLTGDGVPIGAAAALAALMPQQREAWVFARVYGMRLREVAKSMDCSTTATERHLATADEAMQRAMREKASCAAAELLIYTMTLDVPAVYRASRRRRRMRRWALIVLLFVMIFAAAGMAAYLWSHN